MYEDPTFATSASPMPRMKVNVVLSDLKNPYFLVDEWYSKEELEGVWKEIDFLTDFKKFQLDDEQLLSVNLDDSYNNKNISNILSYRYKEKLELFANQVDRSFPEGTAQDFMKCKNINSKLCYFHQAMGQSDNKTTDKFVSYLFLYKKENVFTGGDMLLQNHKVKLHNHRQVFFPGEYSRRVTPIIFSDPKRTLGHGLYLIKTTYN
tara:strand:+ start:313 stop:930 length:618 start_codon:yes stop_codon:yes gene_type:complete